MKKVQIFRNSIDSEGRQIPIGMSLSAIGVSTQIRAFYPIIDASKLGFCIATQYPEGFIDTGFMQNGDLGLLPKFSQIEVANVFKSPLVCSSKQGGS